jgi:hypothetical protein
MEAARKLTFAARAATDCFIASQQTRSAYKIPSLTPAKAWTIHALLAFIAFSRESAVISSGWGTETLKRGLRVSAG